MCELMCVHVCAFLGGARAQGPPMCVCMWVWGCARTRVSAHECEHTHTSADVHIWLCWCACMGAHVLLCANTETCARL